MKKFLKQLWESLKKKMIAVLATAIVGLTTAFGAFIYDVWEVTKEFPELKQYVEEKVAELDSLKAVVENSPKRGFGTMISMEADMTKDEVAKQLGEMIKFNNTYTSIGIFRNNVDHRLWYRAVDNRWYQPIFDASTHYKYTNIHGDILWVY